MAHSRILKQRVIAMRRRGGSINSIATTTGLAKSTVSVWVRPISLPPSIQLKLQNRQLTGWRKGHAAVQARQVFRHRERETASMRVVQRLMHKAPVEFFQLCTALLYWCEGAKKTTALKFANSDPKLVKTFLTTFRKGFLPDESKFRALVHLHEYHDEKKQLLFWSKVTNIPLKQFNRSYKKPHTGKRQKADYPGCITISYGKATLVLDFESLYYTFAKQIEGT